MSAIFQSDNGGEYIPEELTNICWTKECTMNCQHHTCLLKMELLIGSKINEVCMYNDGPSWTVRQMMKPFHLLFVLHLFILAFAVQNGMMVHQMDVVTAFLNGTLDKEIYMKQPPGYIKKGEEHLL